MRNLTVTICLTLAVLLGSVGVSFAATFDWGYGHTYVGEVRNKKFHGQGTYTFVSGNKYVGEFRNNEFHGQGTYTFVGGNKYVGEFREGKPNGRGTHTFTDGRIKEGIWKGGKFIIDFLNGGDAYRRGVAAVQSGDFATAIREWTLAADQGNAVAAVRLGWWYRGVELRVGRKRFRVETDNKTALKLFRIAAKQGIAIGQFSLGVMYENGRGVPQDVKTALKWYTLAAEQGEANAQYTLGRMYDVTGVGKLRRGVPQDVKTALKWYILATEPRRISPEFDWMSNDWRGRGEGSSHASNRIREIRSMIKTDKLIALKLMELEKEKIVRAEQLINRKKQLPRKFDKYEKILKRITMTCLGGSQSGYGRTGTKDIYSTDGKDLYYSSEDIPDRVVRSGMKFPSLVWTGGRISSIEKKKGENIWIFFYRQIEKRVDVEVYVNFKEPILIEDGQKKSCF